MPCAMGQEVFRPHCDMWNGKISSGIYGYKVAGFQIKKDGSLKIRLADRSGSHEVTLVDLESAYFMVHTKAEGALSKMKKKAEQKTRQQKLITGGNHDHARSHYLAGK